MPRPKKPGAGEPKRRSRNGCWPCKARKVKCGEERPRCSNCERQGEPCDYSIRLNWGGRTKKGTDNESSETPTSVTGSPPGSTFSQSEAFAAAQASFTSKTPGTSAIPPPTPHTVQHARSYSGTPTSGPEPATIDPELVRISQTPPLPAVTAGGDFESNQYVSPYESHSFRRAPAFVPQALRYRGQRDYPSPGTLSLDNASSVHASRITSNGLVGSPQPLPRMPPPVRGTSSFKPPINQPFGELLGASGQHHKRQKRSQGDSPGASDVARPDGYWEKPNPPLCVVDAYSPNPGPLSPFSQFGGSLTPGSSIASEENSVRNAPRSSSTSYPPTDLRRLSVNALLTGPPGDNPNGYGNGEMHGRQYPVADSHITTYGYDVGQPDFDTPKNEDERAIAIFSPQASTFGHDAHFDPGARSRNIAFEKDGYYAKPVPVRIPRALRPLPQLLLENQMNLLYFHHFLNHTARILVPHDCEQNPFRKILPEMAVQDTNILTLVLAFSASHRARLLGHPEPVNRIAVWVQDVWPRLRESLACDQSQVSTTTLATSIMLASLNIISPHTFEVPIPWQDHLKIARQMIIARGGPKTMHKSDRVAYFLCRWFAYLDVLGSLSGNKNDYPLGSFYWSSDNLSADEDFQIDCLLGFTNRCIGILARIAELSKQCESQRIDADGNVRQDWSPPDEIIAEADLIRKDLHEGLSDRIVYNGCIHRSSEEGSESELGWDALEIYATNEMFHWAGLIYLGRRVLGKPTRDPEVQQAVREIVGALFKVRRGSSAEACLLFPMFTAGCETLDKGQREKIMERLRSVEEFGMTQVNRARTLMQKVWDTGKPWEALVSGEFFG